MTVPLPSDPSLAAFGASLTAITLAELGGLIRLRILARVLCSTDFIARIRLSSRTWRWQTSPLVSMTPF